MVDPKTTERLRGLVLSANDLKSLTDWPDALIEDYLNILDNLIIMSDLIDIQIDGKIEEIETAFTDGSVPFAESELLVEDNTNLIWDNVLKILTVANAIVSGSLIAINAPVAGNEVLRLDDVVTLSFATEDVSYFFGLVL